jgi:ABC-type multidrug transport system fused ATPase/permease subunit
MNIEPRSFSSARKVWEILNPAEHRRAAMLLGLSIFGMIMETLGVGLVIPALAVMTQTDIGVKHPELAPLLHWLGNPSQVRLVVIGMLVLVAVYAIKDLFLACLAWWQMRFVYGVQAELSGRLFKSYLRQPYVFHLQRNSAQLIRNAVTETNLLAQTVLVAALSVLAESLVAVGIIALMIFVEPVGTAAVVVILGGAVWCFHSVSHTWIAKWGALRQEHEGRRIQHLQEGLGGVKDVRMLGREDDFLAEFGRHNAGYARVGGQFAFIGQLPRLWLEFLAVSGLAALVIVMIWQGRSIESLLPALGLFGVGAFRLMPSANRILSGVQNMRYALPAVDVLHAELGSLPATVEPNRGDPVRLSSVLRMDNVTFRYPGASRPALNGVTVTVAQGSSVGFIGATGAGKSTLVDTLLGLLTPDRGLVTVDGANIQDNLRGWQDQIGYVPQSIFLTDDTLRRNVAFGIPDAQIDDTAVWRAVKAAQIEQMVNELPGGLATLVGERGVRLSGGQRQRVGIARALYHDPAVLVLDEATSSLDTDTERGVMDTVGALQGKKTLIVVAHRLSTVAHCDRLFRLDAGQIVDEGTAAAVLAADNGHAARDRSTSPSPYGDVESTLPYDTHVQR